MCNWLLCACRVTSISVCRTVQLILDMVHLIQKCGSDLHLTRKCLGTRTFPSCTLLWDRTVQSSRGDYMFRSLCAFNNLQRMWCSWDIKYLIAWYLIAVFNKRWDEVKVRECFYNKPYWGRRLLPTALGLDQHRSAGVLLLSRASWSDSEGIVLQLHLPRQTPHRLWRAEMIVPMHISEGECLSVINNLSVFQLYVEAGLLLEQTYNTHLHQCILLTFSWGKQ